MTNYIWVTAQKEMLHKYPDAPKDVEFLRNEHRHIFKFKVYIEVFHNDRDIEFILFKRFVEKVLKYIEHNVDKKSCEMLSNVLAEQIGDAYPKRDIKIEVSEDGENGSLNEYPVSTNINSE